MEKIITLPKSGAQVTLRDPSDIRQKDRRKIFEAMSENSNTYVKGLDMTEGLMAILVKSWTLDLIIPSVRIDSLGELEIADYDALAKECNKVQDILFPDFNDDKDANSPLDKSND
jgi:hypothetical protein